MNFQQLRSIRETVRRGYNLTDVAQVLHTSQPGVSRQIRELEQELGVEFFIRNGKRLTGLTPPGAELLPIVERLLQESDNLRQAVLDFSQRQEGQLSIAATHSQARYALPHVVRDFRALFPKVTLHLHQGSPKQVAAMLISGEADIGVATEALADYQQLVTLPCYRWTHSIVVPKGHALLQELRDSGQPLSLAQLARYPIITYEQGYTGRSHIDQAFRSAGQQPDVVLTAMDADVIKTYVELGMGVGIVASIALDDKQEALEYIDAGHLFQVNVTRLGLRKGAWLRNYAYEFIQTFVPTLKPEVVRQALQEANSGDGADGEDALENALAI